MPALRRWVVVAVLAAITVVLIFATDAGVFVVLGDHRTGWLNPWGFVVVDSTLRFPATIAAVALFAVGVTGTAIARTVPTRIAIAFFGVLTSTVAAVVGIPALFGAQGPANETAYASPDGHLVVLEDPGMEYFLHTTRLVVRTRAGWLSRQHEFACLAGNPEFQSLEWIDAHSVRVSTSDGALRFTFDAEGVPDHRVGAGNDC